MEGGSWGTHDLRWLCFVDPLKGLGLWPQAGHRVLELHGSQGLRAETPGRI